MNPPDIEEGKIHKRLTPSLRAANGDGMAWACMVGAGETYLNIFGIFLKATSVQLGLLATLPQFLGAISQMVGVWAMSFFASRRHIITRFVTLNAFVWVPVALLPFIFEKGASTVWILIALASLYFVTSNFTNPIWNSLIGDLVPAHIRGRYFGYRNRLLGFSTFITILLCGQMLDVSQRYGDARLGFLGVFLIAFLSRLLCVYFLQGYEDPPYHVKHEHHFTFWQFIRRSPKSNFARFVYFNSLMNFGVNIATPFFAVYMLRDLHFSYIELTVITATNTITQFLTMQYWGKISDQFGNKKILNICGYGVALSPLMWVFGSSLWYLLLIQVYAGFVWAGFNLAAANFMFDAVTPPKRARCVAYQAMVNGAFVLVGSLLGGYLGDHLPASVTFAGFQWTPPSGLVFVFVISGLVRVFASLLLLPQFSEVRSVERIDHRELIFRITNIASIAGVTFSILPGTRRRRPTKKE
ncbi:MAG: MFS transporter [Deltaproteobacteria bacterium]|nr:MFS transporter [Deltaproteobacteria bacterium]